MNRTKPFLALILLTLPFMLVAQDEWITEMEGDIVADTIVNLHDSPEIAISTFEKPISILKNYTGYAIELAESPVLLPSNHQDFKGFGKIFYTIFDRRYQFIVPLTFNKKKSIKKYFKNIVQPQQPKARVVRYLNGVRTTIFDWR